MTIAVGTLLFIVGALVGVVSFFTEVQMTAGLYIELSGIGLMAVGHLANVNRK